MSKHPKSSVYDTSHSRRCQIQYHYDETTTVTELYKINNLILNKQEPVPVATRSKAWVCGRSPAIMGSNPAGDMDVCLLCVVR